MKLLKGLLRLLNLIFKVGFYLIIPVILWCFINFLLNKEIFCGLNCTLFLISMVSFLPYLVTKTLLDVDKGESTVIKNNCEKVNDDVFI